MALDKLVDSGQLDTDLTAIANAIRTKGGTSAQLAFPSEFVSAINAISGGGGGGLEYETGTYTPTNDIARPQINFARTHSKPPTIISMTESPSTSEFAANNNVNFIWFDSYRYLGGGFKYTSSNTRYAFVYYVYNSSSNTTGGRIMMSTTTNDSSSTATNSSRYWVDESWFKPYCDSTSRYWRGNHTYKWIAIWATAPTT